LNILKSILSLYHRLWRVNRSSVQESAAVLPATITHWPTVKKIGILAPLPNESAHQLLTGISALLEISSRTTYSVVPFWGDNTRVTLFNYAQQAAKECDLLVTWGVTCANIASEAQELLKDIPIIKAGLRSEQLYKLLPHSAESIVVITQYDYAQQVSLFKKLKPSARSVCITYRHNNDNMRHEATILCQAFRDAGFKTDIQMLAHSAHIDHQLSALHQEYDSIFVMPHTVTASTVQELVTYCSNKKITLCTQEHDVVVLGAVIGFCGHEKTLGSEIGHLVRNIFEAKQQYTSTTTMTHYPIYECVINKNKCKTQGIELGVEYITMLEQVHLVSTTTLTHPSSPENHHVPFNQLL